MIIRKVSRINVVVTDNIKIKCLWEYGGANETGKARTRIICDFYGRKKQAIFTHNKGRKNGHHSLIPLNIDDVIIDFQRSNNLTICGFSISRVDGFEYNYEGKQVCRILEIYRSGLFADFKFDDYVSKMPSSLQRYREALVASIQKSKDINCQINYYSIPAVNKRLLNKAA